MLVYIAREVDYEYDRILGVYASLESACIEGNALRQEMDTDMQQWYLETYKAIRTFYHSSFEVSEHEVKP